MVKWTPEMDQQLLLKILETHELSVDATSVSEAWPGDDPKAKPTPRAITERLVKIKSRIKNGKSATPTSTPTKLATPSPRNRTSAKRKRGNATLTGKKDIKTEAYISPTSNIQTIKHEYNDYADSPIDGMVVPMTMRTLSKYDEAQHESSDSEFMNSTTAELADGYGKIHVNDSEAVGATEYA
ncbi:hypothetical protein I7I50_08887 [Histoplasma capsulatum G186AR]|uniref:Uncharacterized protein n=1 Tax=Ajellomyces capsulatus TaxID=5037 RepID=A0A8H7YUI8_AJECA|nr:hypothetical protein I7I52_06403 [Histoplasma capsulatum]QSS73933.1 hypothetical protein I7I50_08887 [Histoplasma capsulatum G186AR]